MAQWVPKTTWRLSNLNKLYGVHEIGLNLSKNESVPYAKYAGRRHTPFLAAPNSNVPAAFRASSNDEEDGGGVAAASEVRNMLKAAYAAQVPFIDLRDAYEVERAPLKGALVFHHHDLLSGACNDILPRNRRMAHIVVFASSRQRALNGYKALKRWGFDNVVVADAGDVVGIDESPEGKSAAATATE